MLHACVLHASDIEVVYMNSNVSLLHGILVCHCPAGLSIKLAVAWLPSPATTYSVAFLDCLSPSS